MQINVFGAFFSRTSYREIETNKTNKQINLIRWAGEAVSDEVYAMWSTRNYPIMGQNMGQQILGYYSNYLDHYVT